MMIDFQYLATGLYGMANAHKAGSLAGHLGAALVAGYFFGEDLPDLDDGVYRGVERELDRIVRGEEQVWFNPQKAGITIAELFRRAAGENLSAAGLAWSNSDVVFTQGL